MKAPTVDYHGKELVLEPSNCSFRDVVMRLKDARVAPVVLENMGDGTRYSFFLIPCWNATYFPACGGGIGDGQDYIFVAPFKGRGYPIAQWCGPHYVREKTDWHGGTTHSAKVLSTFLNAVWDGIRPELSKEEV